MKTSKLPRPLQEELRLLAMRVCECAPSQEQRQGLALVRLAPGLSMDAWRALADRDGFEGWLALDIADIANLAEAAHNAQSALPEPKPKENQTLVLPCEKQFLFFGG